MLLSSIPLLLYAGFAVAFEGKSLSEDVVGYLGIRYAEPPVREKRFKESQTVVFDEESSYVEWPLGCPDVAVAGRSEDCLFLNLLQHKRNSKKVDTLLIFSNEKLSETKLVGLVSPSLNIVTAGLRCGLLGAFNGMPFGVSDVINAVKFLRDNADVLHIGKITVWAEALAAETVASALSRTDVERVILINGNSRTRTIGRAEFPKRAVYKLITALECDLPSNSQAMDCLRTKPLSELYKAAGETAVRSPEAKAFYHTYPTPWKDEGHFASHGKSKMKKGDIYRGAKKSDFCPPLPTPHYSNSDQPSARAGTVVPSELDVSPQLSKIRNFVALVNNLAKKAFYPFGIPFRSPSYEQPAIPTILGVFRQLPKEYPTDSDFDEKFQYVDFKKFLAGLIPSSQFRNAPLLRRQILHQYIYTQGDKKNTYFLFEQMRKRRIKLIRKSGRVCCEEDNVKRAVIESPALVGVQSDILLDRDFIAPTQQLVSELKQKKGAVYLLEYGIDNPPVSCLQDGGWDDIKPFCDKMFQYFTRFATKGQPTKNSCEPTNPTWPAMGSSKRDYHVILKAEGIIEWESNFHLASTQLWNNFLLALDALELKGRRDEVFKEETQLEPHEVEDDVQEWHRKASEDGDFDFALEHSLEDMPFHMEL